MKSLENLDEQIKEIFLLNGGDINIEEYPYILKEAEEHGISQAELSKRINKVHDGIDWRPYHRIDKLLENILLKGSITEKEADGIITAVENELQRPVISNYIVSTIKKRHFFTREKNSFEHDSFKNRWMTDEAWARYQKDKNVVEWLKEEAHSLAEIGEISFRKPEDTKYYLRNTNYLVPSITTLTKSASSADEFSKIIENEPNPDKRYLKVVYRLNPELPFRLNNKNFATIAAMVDQTATDYSLFIIASESYSNGHIHIWLNETDPVQVNKLTSGYDYNSYLKFIYSINSHHPFYLGSIKFDTPEQFIQSAEKDAFFWNKIADAMENQQLPVWFTAIGKQDWLKLFSEKTAKINASPIDTEEEKRFASVQSLIQVVDPKVSDPKITCNPERIQLLAIEGSKKVQYTIRLKLENTGFVKAAVSLSKNVEGISLDKNTLTFWSQNNQSEQPLTVSIDALQLIKNKTYSSNIMIDTAFQKLVIPLEAKVVFPKNAYLIQMLKYALFGGAFFAIIRYVTGIISGNDSWFGVPESPYYAPDFLPDNYFSYFVGLVFLIGGLISAIFIIRKLEKI